MKITSINYLFNQILIKSRLSRLMLFGFVVSLIISCDSNLVFEKNITVDANAWKASEPVIIDFQISDTLSLVNLYVNIRHNTDFEKSNLYLFVETIYPNSYKTVDTLEFILAEPDGKWIGNGFGKVKSLQVPIAHGVRFPMSGDYEMRFEQAMRTTELAGIEDIGLRIEKMQDN